MTRAQNLWAAVCDRAEMTPDTVMAVDEHRRAMTFGGFRQEAERTAAGLVARGVSPGDVVSWQLPNRFEAAVVAAALARLGAVQNPIIPMLRAREVSFICRQAGTDLLIVPSVFRGFDHAKMAAGIAAGQPGLDVLVVDGSTPVGDASKLGGDEAGQALNRWYFYTSGTTSDPKGARHDDGTLAASSSSVATALRVSAADRITLLAPITHIGGLSHVVTSLRTGCRLIFSETFDPETTAQFLRGQGATLVGSGVPFLRAYLAYQRSHPDEPRLFPSARAFLCGGALRPAGLQNEVRTELGGIGIVSGYGLTECPHLAWTSVDDSEDDRATTEGRPAAGVDVRVVAGELRVRGPQLMSGYVDSSLDRDAFDDEGYLRTGDLGQVDSRGYITITGRLKDVIIRNMENISAREVEEGLLSHPAVDDVAVVGLPDQATGERVCAVVVPADFGEPPSLADLCGHLLSAGMSSRKLPERLEIVEALPRNAMGKVAKPELRRRLAGR
jgi:acyl-CoA synthetase (AMP-forming)/AMP-acid ligase II